MIIGQSGPGGGIFAARAAFEALSAALREPPRDSDVLARQRNCNREEYR
jgi:hypothetical protein